MARGLQAYEQQFCQPLPASQQDMAQAQSKLAQAKAEEDVAAGESLCSFPLPCCSIFLRLSLSQLDRQKLCTCCS